MIEILDRSSDKVVGIRVAGKLLHEDYQQFVPMLERRIADHGSVRCLVEMIDLHGIAPAASGMRSSSTSSTRDRSSVAPSWATAPGRTG